MINAELANTIGALLHRITAKKVNPTQLYPHFDARIFDEYYSHTEGRQLIDEINAICGMHHHLIYATTQIRTHDVFFSDKCTPLYDRLHFYHVLENVNSLARLANSFVQQSTPWNLSDQSTIDVAKRNTVNYILYETTRVIAVLMQPIVPTYADSMFRRLGIDNNSEYRLLKYARFVEYSSSLSDRPIGADTGPIFARLNTDTATAISAVRKRK